jgi:folate-binding protein YgfZ
MLAGMKPMELHEAHRALNAVFTEVNGAEVVQGYGDATAEHAALGNAAGVLDLSFRDRLCLTGEDRIRFLNGQVTNNIKALSPGQGCYAALTTAKGRMESDLHSHCLKDELLLDLEPGLASRVSARLEKFIVADDVEVVDVKPHYGLLSVQGPKATAVLQQLRLTPDLPQHLYQSVVLSDPHLGEIVLVNLPRFGSLGFDLFVPNTALGVAADRLITAAKTVGGCVCGWEAMEMRRIEAGIPRYGWDMDETNIPLEAGLEVRAISYSKGCYVGQEVINRIHSIGQVSKAWRGLHLTRDTSPLPLHGDRLYHEGQPAGYVTSVLNSSRFNRPLALGYVRREMNQTGATLSLSPTAGGSQAVIVDLPFSEA